MGERSFIVLHGREGDCWRRIGSEKGSGENISRCALEIARMLFFMIVF